MTTVIEKILEGADIRQALTEASEEKYTLMNDIIKKLEDMPVDEFILNYVDTEDKEKLASDLNSGFLPFNIKGKDMELSLKDGRLEYDGTSMGGSRELYFKVKEIAQEIKDIVSNASVRESVNWSLSKKNAECWDDNGDVYCTIPLNATEKVDVKRPYREKDFTGKHAFQYVMDAPNGGQVYSWDDEKRDDVGIRDLTPDEEDKVDKIASELIDTYIKKEGLANE
jgi:hypothetical protein